MANMLAIFVVVPLIHPLRITSAYEVIFPWLDGWMDGLQFDVLLDSISIISD